MSIADNKNIIRSSFTVLAAILLMLSLYNLFKVATQMTDENLYANRKQGVVFIEINPGGVSEQAGLRIGDHLLKINGDSIISANQAQSYLDRAKPGESLVYTIEREDQIYDIRLNLALGGVRIFQVGFFSAGLLLFSIALIFVWIKPENGHARIWALAMLLVSFSLMNTQVVRAVQEQSLFYRTFALLYVVNLFLMVATLGHAILYFPEQKYAHIKRFWMIHANYILAGLMILFSLYMIFSLNYFTPVLIWIPLAYLIIIEIIFWKKRQKSYLARTRVIKIIFLAMTLVLGVAVPFMLRYRLVEYISFLFCALPITFAYTTIRYRIYDIHLRLRLSTFYFLTQIFLAVYFVFMIIVLIRILPTLTINLPAFFITGTVLEMRKQNQLPADLQLIIQKGYLLLIGIGSAFLLFIFVRFMQRLMDRIFFQQKYDYRKALKNFVEILSSYLTRESIGIKSVEQIQDIMKIKGTLLVVAENGCFKPAVGKGTLIKHETKPFTITSELNKKWTSAGKPIALDDLYFIPELNIIRSEIYCAIPVVSVGAELEALLFTAEKLSESAYNNDDIELLSLFGEHLGTAFERAKLYEEMADKERISRELEIAREIQINSLPKQIPEYPGLQIRALLSPATEVGGDYYDYFEIDSDHLGIIVGDVVGKGTSAALHMSKIQGFLRTLSLEKVPQVLMLQRLNTLIRQNFSDDFFFTALYGIFNTTEKSLQLFRLGHNGLFYYNARQRQTMLFEPPGMGFGMAGNEVFIENIQMQEIKYEPGDIFLFLTDGFTEAMNENRQVYGESRILEFLSTAADQSANDIVQGLNRNMLAYSNSRQFDDATAVVVKIV